MNKDEIQTGDLVTASMLDTDGREYCGVGLVTGTTYHAVEVYWFKLGKSRRHAFSGYLTKLDIPNE